MKLLETIKSSLRPNKTENVDLLKTLEKHTPANVEVFLGGSFAKKTHIKNDFDIDVFVRFPDNKNISKRLKKILDVAKINYKEIPGSRNYFEVKDSLTYEIVPVKKVENPKQAENVIDLSPFHVKYFNDNASKTIRDEVRLLKKFLKANNLYGSETHIKGFSGHTVDLLVLYYKSFLNVIKQAQNWKEKVVIDIENIHEFPLMTLNKSKLKSPLVIVDPTDPYRNTAAALSKANFVKFINLANHFLKNPTKTYFENKNLHTRIKQNTQKNVYILNIKPLKRTKNISAAKARKAYENIIEELEKLDFDIEYTDWEFDEENTQIAISVKNENLSKTKVIEGPPTDLEEHAHKFRKKHDDIKEKDEILHAKKTRNITNIKKAIKHIIKLKYIKTCYKSATLEKSENT